MLGSASAAACRRFLPVPVLGRLPALGDAGPRFAGLRTNTFAATAAFPDASHLTPIAQMRLLASKAKAAEVEPKTTRPKRAADPDRPKRPTSAWILFLSHFRKKESEKAESIRRKGVDVMRGAAAEWSVMTPEMKRPFEEPAQKAKQAYDVQYKEYVDSGKKDAWKRDPERPKKPLTGYMRFLQTFRTNNPTLKLTEAAKAGANAWKALSDPQKAPYMKAYTTDKAEFDKLMAAYKASGKEEAWKKKVGLVEAPKKAKEATTKPKGK